MTAEVVKVGDGGIKQKRKRTHGHGPQCVDCGDSGCMEVEQGIRGINGDGKIQ